MLVRHLLALRHRQVMKLVVRTAHEQPDEAETADVHYLLGSLDVTVKRTPLGSASVLALQPFIWLSSCAWAGTIRWIAASVRPLPVTEISPNHHRPASPRHPT